MAAQEDLPLPPVLALFPHIYDEPQSAPQSIDPFTITTSSGFLPARLPLVSLPEPFSILNEILTDMPIVKANGEAGLLATFQLGAKIDSGVLPDLTQYIESLVAEDGKLDLNAVTAAFRDYSFLASAYLLEPCWEHWSKDNSAGYGLGRSRLPACVARPLYKTAEILDLPPFMSYAASYALYNYSLVDPTKGASVYSNIRLVRAFERGLDPKSSEAGFILTHIHMVEQTGPLIAGALSLVSTISDEPSNKESAKAALRGILTAMTGIEAAMENMWHQSLPKEYLNYRVFIFGITNQSMFPDGVFYEGCDTGVTRDGKPNALFFRGESGANDSIIPLLDHLCQIPMPKNPLTDILRDFRSYRPKPHRMFLAWVESKAVEVGVRDYCSMLSCEQEDRDYEIPALFLRVLEHVRSFRWRHWLFAREYIIKRSQHPTATGGSPIVTWLPNQLFAVMDLMDRVVRDSGLKDLLETSEVGESEAGVKKIVGDIMEKVQDARHKLEREVQKYCVERGL